MLVILPQTAQQRLDISWAGLNNTGHAIEDDVLTNNIMSNTAASLLLQVTSCPVQLPHQITTAAAAAALLSR